MGGSTEDALKISHVTAIILGLLYFQFLLFQLKTHVHLFADDDEKEVRDTKRQSLKENTQCWD